MYFHSVIKRYPAYYVLLFLLSNFDCYSQDYVYKHYDVQDGLPNSSIYSISQDREGFLWIGTETALSRYDGSRFKTFSKKDGLPANRIYNSFQDSKGRIWLSQLSGYPAYILNGKVYNHRNTPLLKKIIFGSGFIDMAEDNEGNLVFGDLNKLFILSRQDSLKTIEKIDGAPFNFVGIGLDSNGKLIVVANHDGYKVMDDPLKDRRDLIYYKRLSSFSLQDGGLKHIRTFKTYKGAPEGANEYVLKALVHPDYFFMDFYNGERMVIHKGAEIEIVKNIKDENFNASAISDSVFAYNTTDGSLLFNLNTGKSTKVLPGKIVSHAYKDKENNLWFGTMSEGLYKISSPAIKNRVIGSAQSTIGYLGKAEGKIIVGTSNREVFEINSLGEINKLTPAHYKNPASSVIYQEKTGPGKYFMVHQSGLLSYEKEKVLIDYAGSISAVSPLDNDHVLAASRFGTFKINKHDLLIKEIITKTGSRVAFKTGDSMLICFGAGLFVIKKNQDKYYIENSLLKEVVVTHIEKSANNLIWLGTFEDGLFCISNGKIIKHFTEASNLPSNNGRCLKTNNNDVWFGTDKGLAKISQVGDSFYVRKYSTSDGLASDLIDAVLVDSNYVYTGSPKGLSYFDERLVETNSICNLVLTGVSIGDSTMDLSNRFMLSTNERIAVEFSGVSLRSGQDMIFRYKIHGLDENWRTSKLNVLEFTALPHGNYDLEIIAINKFGKESKPLKIQLEVVRPFHKSTWFVLLMILVPVMGLLLLINLRINNRRAKQMQQLQQEIRITKLEQMALRAQMNPHFIFNCISAIQQLVTEKDNDNASRFISSFAELVRQTLDNAPELYISLPEEIRFLNNYFELERIRLEDRFSYNIRTDGIIAKEQIRVPNMVIQPFVENAIKHGIRYKKNGKGFIEAIFEQEGNLLRCTITDNGVGREKAMKMKMESGINHMSKGMAITLKRIESLNALTNQKIYIGIEDLKDAQQQAIGTSVKIEIYNINDSYDKDNIN